MNANRTITVYGASGHTGQFVVAELRRRGWVPVLSGRDPDKLRAAADGGLGELEIRPAAVDSPTAIDHALDGSAAVINCAGPFRWTAAPVIEAALRAGIPYLDVAAEIEAVADTFAHYDEPARDAGIVVVPAMAFYGGLGDLLATAATPGWTSADEVTIAYGLNSWRPTQGTLCRRQGLEATPRRTPHRLSQRTPRAPHRRRTDRRMAVPGAARYAEGPGRLHHGRLRHHPPPPRHARHEELHDHLRSRRRQRPGPVTPGRRRRERARHRAPAAGGGRLNWLPCLSPSSPPISCAPRRMRRWTSSRSPRGRRARRPVRRRRPPALPRRWQRPRRAARDLGPVAADLDFTTDAHPPRSSRCSRAGPSAVWDTGIAFGTVAPAATARPWRSPRSGPTPTTA